MTLCKNTLSKTGFLKRQQKEQDVKGNTHTNVFESIYPSWNHMWAYNKNCGFKPTYIPCHIGSEEKNCLKKIIVKHDWIKETLTFSRCSLSYRLSIFFHHNTLVVAPHNKRGLY